MARFVYFIAATINIGWAFYCLTQGQGYYFASHAVVGASLFMFMSQSRFISYQIDVLKDTHNKVVQASKVKRKF